MNPLLISGFGTSIYVEKRKLVICNKLENTFQEFHPHKIDHDGIIIDGHTGNISFEAMRWMMKHNINMVLLNWNGNLLANTLPDQPKSGKLRIRQYEKYLDDNYRFEIASKITQTKVEHSLNLLLELSRYYDSIDMPRITQSVKRERQFLLKITPKNQHLGMKIKGKNLRSESSNQIKKLMTYEGRIAEVCLSQITSIYNELYPEFHFTGRKDKTNSRNYNASDEINALLNYGYAILESEIRKSLNAIGLDYAVGFLHEINQSKTPLVYDIQELFRWIIDLSVIQLLEEKKIKKSDFITTENYHIRLKEKTAKMLIEKIRKNFNHKKKYKNNKKFSYQNILQDNLQQLANFISGKKKDFEFDIPKITIQRNDDVQIREKILNMTPQQRKLSGINKSTLWYLKSNLTKGKKVMIYDKIKTKLENGMPNVSPKA
ncbi:MAG: CRISPR-associated endonuclease Cas1 [Nitrosopumilus sp.]|uniref:CRISPR-associated endonuclease Cas1 n=1 Tax=Nitrosopumilus sp. TaxID=2024843 RepID=UPI00246C7DF8|nr:CRISPR-associated endonuclease Cas1 [Nitrosopumilus sp.]MDH5431747.1 CRISPR-associated endonuclease Cas1 [Nitrosopumilus sp.]